MRAASSSYRFSSDARRSCIPGSELMARDGTLQDGAVGRHGRTEELLLAGERRLQRRERDLELPVVGLARGDPLQQHHRLVDLAQPRLLGALPGEADDLVAD